MNASELIAELGTQLGIALNLSDAGTCRVVFDEDTIDFEQSGEAFYIMADIASATDKKDACERLLAANYLGTETGGCCIGLDTARDMFTLHTILYGDMEYAFFEAALTRFVKSLRYWKEWLAQPLEQDVAQITFMEGMIRA